MLRVRPRWSSCAVVAAIAVLGWAPAARADVEPNDVPVRAEGLPASTTTVSGTVGPGDVDDWYRLVFTGGGGEDPGHIQLTRTSGSTPGCRAPGMHLIDHTYGGGIGFFVGEPDASTAGTSPHPGVSVFYFHVEAAGCDMPYSAEITTSGGAGRLDATKLTAQPVPESGDTAATAFRPLAEGAWYSGEISGPADEDWVTFSVGPGTHTVGIEGAVAANGTPFLAMRLTTDPASPGVEFDATTFGVRETLSVTGPAQLWARVANKDPFAGPIPWWLAVDAGGAVVPAPGQAAAPGPAPPPVPITGAKAAPRVSCAVATGRVRRPRPIRVTCKGAAKGARVEVRLQRVRGRTLGRAVRRTLPVRGGTASRTTRGLARGTYRVSVFTGSRRLALRRVSVR